MAEIPVAYRHLLLFGSPGVEGAEFRRTVRSHLFRQAQQVFRYGCPTKTSGEWLNILQRNEVEAASTKSRRDFSLVLRYISRVRQAVHEGLVPIHHDACPRPMSHLSESNPNLFTIGSHLGG